MSLNSQDLLTRHKVLVAEHLEQNYDAVSALGHTLIHTLAVMECKYIYISKILRYLCLSVSIFRYIKQHWQILCFYYTSVI